MEEEEKEGEKGKGMGGEKRKEGGEGGREGGEGRRGERREKRDRGEGRAARGSSPEARMSCLPKPQPLLQKPSGPLLWHLQQVWSPGCPSWAALKAGPGAGGPGGPHRALASSLTITLSVCFAIHDQIAFYP